MIFCCVAACLFDFPLGALLPDSFVVLGSRVHLIEFTFLVTLPPYRYRRSRCSHVFAFVACDFIRHVFCHSPFAAFSRVLRFVCLVAVFVRFCCVARLFCGFCLLIALRLRSGLPLCRFVAHLVLLRSCWVSVRVYGYRSGCQFYCCSGHRSAVCVVLLCCRLPCLRRLFVLRSTC